MNKSMSDYAHFTKDWITLAARPDKAAKFKLYTIKVAWWSFSGSIPPKFAYVSINKDLEKLPPQLF